MKGLLGVPAIAVLWLASGGFSPARHPGRALWPGAKFTDRDRDAAIRRGLNFIYRTSSDAKNFEQYGADYLWCFYGVAATSSDHQLSWLAQRMGQVRARQWRIENPAIPDDANAGEITWLVFGSYAAERLGARDDKMKQQLSRAAARYGPADYLEYDPAIEPPPTDVPAACPKCGRYNSRGARVCEKCASPLTMKSPYEVLLDSLITTYSGDRYGVRLGRGMEDVMQWLPRMHPYRGRERGRNHQWWDEVYAVTHAVYALNGYSFFRLKPEWLPAEFAFLRANLQETIDTGDAETAGELLDTLKSFGLTSADPMIRAAIEFTLSRQNPDGSWGDPNATDVYDRYHPTWTAIDGLREYAWHGERVTSPEALRRAQARTAAQ